LAKAQEVAAEMGDAQGVTIDLADANLGLGGRAVSAVAVLLKDDAIAGLRLAQARGVPHLSISAGATEIGPEVAAYVERPRAAPLVLGAEMLVGAVSVPTLELVKAFRRVDDITVGALLDEQDSGGPATVLDMQRMAEVLPAALTRRDGAFVWRLGENAKARFRAIDGTEIEAVAFSPYDVMGLAAATGAPNVQFNIASGVSSTRRRGEPMSTELIIELAGEDHAGQPLRTRHAILHRKGQMPPTALGVAMILERLLGLDGKPATLPGLYFPYQLIERAAYLARLEQIGGTLMKLDVL
jgi:hypothetical protein